MRLKRNTRCSATSDINSDSLDSIHAILFAKLCTESEISKVFERANQYNALHERWIKRINKSPRNWLVCCSDQWFCDKILED